MLNAEYGMQNGEAVETSESDSLADDTRAANEPAKQENNRAHLTSSVPRTAKIPEGVLTKGQMAEMREIFGGMDDAEIQRLYKRVTK